MSWPWLALRLNSSRDDTPARDCISEPGSLDNLWHILTTSPQTSRCLKD
jgi:hypothetical protein